MKQNETLDLSYVLEYISKKNPVCRKLALCQLITQKPLPESPKTIIIFNRKSKPCTTGVVQWEAVVEEKDTTHAMDQLFFK